MTFWNQKKVLVTGATGLVGSALTKALILQNASVIALIRDPNPQTEFYQNGSHQKAIVASGSLEDYSCIERIINKYEVDTVFHLGAQTIVGAAFRNPFSTFEANIRGTYNLLEACRHHKFVSRVVIASSDKAYGESDILPYTEMMPVAGKHPYDVSKSCVDLISTCYFKTYDLPIAIARCGNIYGEGDLNWSRLIPGTIRSLFLEQNPIIRSDGKFTRDYIYVEDVVGAYLCLGENLHRPEIRGEAFNFGPEIPYSVLEIVQTLQRLMNTPHLEPKILNLANAEIRDQSLNSQKAKQLLKWNHRYSLEEGLAKTIEWYKFRLSNPLNMCSL